MVAEEPEDENDFLELHPSKSQRPVQMASNIEVSSPEEEAAKVLKSVFKCTHLLEHCHYQPQPKRLATLLWDVFSALDSGMCPAQMLQNVPCVARPWITCWYPVRKICNLLGQPIHNIHNGANEESDTDTIPYGIEDDESAHLEEEFKLRSMLWL